MDNILMIDSLGNKVVAKKMTLNLNYNSSLKVPANHVVISLFRQTQDKQRMFEGVHQVKALTKKIGFLDQKSKKASFPLDVYIVNTDFMMDNPWGGRIIFEDQETHAEISVGCNGTIEYKLSDYEYLYDMMIKDSIDVIDKSNVTSIYEKQKMQMNNTVINHLSDWMNAQKSIKDLNNKRSEAEQYVIKQFNSKPSQSAIKVTNFVILEYISNEAEANRKIKNSTNTIDYIQKKTKGES